MEEGEPEQGPTAASPTTVRPSAPERQDESAQFISSQPSAPQPSHNPDYQTQRPPPPYSVTGILWLLRLCSKILISFWNETYLA